MLELPRRDLPVPAGLLQQPGGHLPRFRVLVLQKIADLPFELPRSFDVAATGQEITVIGGKCTGC